LKLYASASSLVVLSLRVPPATHGLLRSWISDATGLLLLNKPSCLQLPLPTPNLDLILPRLLSSLRGLTPSLPMPPSPTNRAVLITGWLTFTVFTTTPPGVLLPVHNRAPLQPAGFKEDLTTRANSAIGSSALPSFLVLLLNPLDVAKFSSPTRQCLSLIVVTALVIVAFALIVSEAAVGLAEAGERSSTCNTRLLLKLYAWPGP